MNHTATCPSSSFWGGTDLSQVARPLSRNSLHVRASTPFPPPLSPPGLIFRFLCNTKFAQMTPSVCSCSVFLFCNIWGTVLHGYKITTRTQSSISYPEPLACNGTLTTYWPIEARTYAAEPCARPNSGPVRTLRLAHTTHIAEAGPDLLHDCIDRKHPMSPRLWEQGWVIDIL